MNPAVTTYDVWLSISDSRNRPTPIRTVPTIGNSR